MKRNKNNTYRIGKLGTLQAGVVFSSLAILVLFIFMSLKTNRAQTAFLDLKKVYSEFELAKELDTQLEEVNTERQIILDSLLVRIRALENSEETSLNKTALQLLQQEYLLKEQQMMEDSEYLSADYNSKIITQLNQYLEDYRKQKGFDYILGASGNGNIMAADTRLDISEDVILFINQHYSGAQ